MSIVHGYLLGGMILAGLPILVHLIMRQKPKTLPFPAFRFLKQRHLINRRKLRLQHLLLLLLRMLLIALLCMALVEPSISLHGLGFSSTQPIDAVLIVDTSPSMEYSVSKKSRLDEAKERARELLGEMALASRVAVLDTAEDPGSLSVADLRNIEYARARIDSLRIHSANAALNRQVIQAFRLLEQVDQKKDSRPRFVYIFSDRTRACWDGSESARPNRPRDIQVVFLDLGVEEPRDLAIDSVEVDPPVAAPGSRIHVHVTVRGTGGDHENEISCHIVDDAVAENAGERQKTIKLRKDESQTVSFVRVAPKREEPAEYPCQVMVKLATTDALPFNNVHYTTFLVRRPRQVLTIAADRDAAFSWKASLEALATERPADAFRCAVVTPTEANGFSEEQWRQYKVVCFFETVSPTPALWGKLGEFVTNGGGLVIVPPGDDAKTDQVRAFNEQAEKADVLPARLGRVISVTAGKQGIPWAEYSARHALTAPFRKWSQADTPDLEKPETRPIANAYWEVEPIKESTVVANYADDKRRPSLIERSLGRGRIVQFTTVLDGRMLDRNRPWNNYFNETWFGLVLVNETCRYLSGDLTRPELNYWCSQPISIGLTRPTPHEDYRYRLIGPELSESESAVPAKANQKTLDLPQAVTPGNYTLLDEKNIVLAGFSLNIRAEESQLDHVPIDEIEKSLGDGAVVSVGRAVSLKEALKGLWSPPLDLVPWLMLLVLLALAVESFLANKVYHRPPTEVENSGAAP
jgi:hypothetical protein